MHLNPGQLFILTIVFSVVLLTLLIGILYCIIKRCQHRRNISLKRKGKNRKKIYSNLKGKNQENVGWCSFCYHLLSFRRGSVDENYNYESIAHSLDDEELDFKRQLEEQCEYEFGDLDSEEEEDLDDEFSLEGYDYKEPTEKGYKSGGPFVKERKDRYRQINTLEENEDDEGIDEIGPDTDKRYDYLQDNVTKMTQENYRNDEETKQEIEENEEEKQRQRSLDKLFDYDVNHNHTKMTQKRTEQDYAIEMTNCNASTTEVDDIPAKKTIHPEDKTNKSVRIQITDIEEEEESEAKEDVKEVTTKASDAILQKSDFSFPRPRTSTIISSRIKTNKLKSPSSQIESSTGVGGKQ